MQVQVEIGFEQLVKIVKTLPASQWKKLKAEIEKDTAAPANNLKSILLNGPVATKKQLKTIADNRKAINKWRTK